MVLSFPARPGTASFALALKQRAQPLHAWHSHKLGSLRKDSGTSGLPSVLKDALRAEMAPAAPVPPRQGEHPRVMGCKAPDTSWTHWSPAVPRRTHGPHCGQTDRRGWHCRCHRRHPSCLLLLRTVLEQLGHLLPHTSPLVPAPQHRLQPLPLPQLRFSPGKPQGCRHPLGMGTKRRKQGRQDIGAHTAGAFPHGSPRAAAAGEGWWAAPAATTAQPHEATLPAHPQAPPFSTPPRDRPQGRVPSHPPTQPVVPSRCWAPPSRHWKPPRTWAGGRVVAGPRLAQQPAAQRAVGRGDAGARPHLGALPARQGADAPLGPLLCRGVPCGETSGEGWGLPREPAGSPPAPGAARTSCRERPGTEDAGRAKEPPPRCCRPPDPEQGPQAQGTRPWAQDVTQHTVLCDPLVPEGARHRQHRSPSPRSRRADISKHLALIKLDDLSEAVGQAGGKGHQFKLKRKVQRRALKGMVCPADGLCSHRGARTQGEAGGCLPHGGPASPWPVGMETGRLEMGLGTSTAR